MNLNSKNPKQTDLRLQKKEETGFTAIHRQATSKQLVVIPRPLTALVRRIEQKIVSLINNDRFLAMQIDITNLCNLRCRHCYHPNHNNDGALSLKEWFQVIDQYEAVIERIQFDAYLIICGGEPLLSPMLKPILDRLRASKFKYKVSILTNGTLAEQFDFSIIAGLDSPSFQVSLDGPDAISHDSVRGKGSFERALKGIKTIQKNGNAVDLLTVLSKRNMSLVPAFFDVAKSLDVASIGFTRLIPLGIAKDLVSSAEDRPLEPLELRDAMQTILIESNRTGVQFNPHKPLFHLLHHNLGRSGRFSEGLVVDHRGNILASSRSRLTIGHVFKEGLEKTLFTHPLFVAIRRGAVETCGKCSFYSRCGGDRNAAYAQNGNYLGADPGCWLQAQSESKILKTKHHSENII